MLSETLEKRLARKDEAEHIKNGYELMPEITAKLAESPAHTWLDAPLDIGVFQSRLVGDERRASAVLTQLDAEFDTQAIEEELASSD
jgi:hypothetical protein